MAHEADAMLLFQKIFDSGTFKPTSTPSEIEVMCRDQFVDWYGREKAEKGGMCTVGLTNEKGGRACECACL